MLSPTIQLILVMILCFFSMGYGQPSQMDLDRLLNQYYSDSQEPGAVLLIAQEGQQIGSVIGTGNRQTFEPLQIHTNFRMASLSKHYTAWAVAHCLNEEGVSFNEPIKRFFPELGALAEDITIAHLMNHSSGIPDYESRIGDGQTGQLSDADVLSLISPLDALYFEPGSGFRYSNTAYCLLTLLIERVTETPYADYVRMNLFDPLDLEFSAVFQATEAIANRAYGYHPEGDQYFFADQSVTSATKGDGGIYTSGSDFHRFSLYHQRFLDKHEDLGTQPNSVSEGIGYFMGLFQARTKDGQTVYFHSGETTGFRHIFLRVPEQDLVISLFTNRDDLKIAELFDEVMHLMEIEIAELNTEPLYTWLSRVYADQLGANDY
ncbi:MAG: serine hydrolase domain-containing protein [Sphingobacterium sp.]